MAVLYASTMGDGGTLFVAQATVPAGPLPTGAFDPNARRISAWSSTRPAGGGGRS